MNEKELLSTIAAMFEEQDKRSERQVSELRRELSEVNQKVSGLQQGMADVNQKVSALDEKVSNLEQNVTKIQVHLENDISKKMDALFEGHKLNSEVLNSMAKTLENLEAASTASDIMHSIAADEIIKLKIVK